MHNFTHLNLRATALLFAFLMMSPHQLFADAFGYQAINVPEQGIANVLGITDSGTMYGNVVTNSTSTYGFFLAANNITTESLGYLTFVTGVNNSGQAIGFFYPPPSLEPLGYVTTISNFGSYTPVQVPGATDDYPTGINDKGQIVGVSSTGVGFLLSGGIYSPIAFPGATGTDPNGINDSGQVVGFYFDSTGVEHGFLEGGGSFSTINVPGAVTTDATGINNLGQIVGYYTVGPPSSQQVFGFLLQDNSFTVLADTGAIYTFPEGINDLGQIVGIDYTTQGQTLNFEATLTSTPEPTTCSLCGLAICILFYCRRKSRSARNSSLMAH